MSDLRHKDAYLNGFNPFKNNEDNYDHYTHYAIWNMICVVQAIFVS